MDGGHAIDPLGEEMKRDNQYMVTARAMPGAFPSYRFKAVPNPRSTRLTVGKSKSCNFIP